MKRSIFSCIFLMLLSLHAICALAGEWPLPELQMRAEAEPLAALPAVEYGCGTATVRVHLVGAQAAVQDSVTLSCFVGADTLLTARAGSAGSYEFAVPLMRTTPAILDGRCYLLLSPGDTTEVWLSQRSPLVRSERRVFVRGPFASLLSDINNARALRSVLLSHLSMPTSDIQEFMLMEKGIMDMLRTVNNCTGELPPLVMDEVLLVCRNPKIVLSRWFPDVLAVVRSHNILVPRHVQQELKFSSIVQQKRRGKPVPPSDIVSFPEPFQQFFGYLFGDIEKKE